LGNQSIAWQLIFSRNKRIMMDSIDKQ
jgi:hypothetical protein